MDKHELPEIDITDILCDKPIGFSIGTRYYTIAPPSLGESLLRAQIFKQLELQSCAPELLSTSILIALRNNKYTAARFIALCTLSGKNALDTREQTKRADIINKALDDKEIAALLMTVITSDNTERAIIQLGIDKEQDKQRRISDIKSQSSCNSVTTGGVSLYGSLIGQACEKYGWTYDECVWGISYANLRLLLADSINTAILDEKERRKINIPRRGEKVINAGDKKNLDKLTQEYLNQK